jgi:hypothetical protein
MGSSKSVMPGDLATIYGGGTDIYVKDTLGCMRIGVVSQVCFRNSNPLTHKCRTYDHGIRLSIHIQFCHLKFR